MSGINGLVLELPEKVTSVFEIRTADVLGIIVLMLPKMVNSSV